MTTKEIVIIVVCAILMGIGSCVMIKHDKKIDTSIKSTILPKDIVENIVIDPDTHTIEIIKPGSDKKTYLPDHPIAITESTNGDLSIQERTYGFEHKGYFGAGLSEGFRAHIGIDWFYFHSFDLGAGVNSDCKNIDKTAADLNLSYNFYSHTSIAVSYSTNHMAGVFLKFRF